MNWFDLFILFPIGFLYPSFKIYVAVARQQQVDIFLKHFVVMSVFITVSQLFDAVFGSFWIVGTAKIVVLWLLVTNNFYGSSFFFDYLIGTVTQIAPFIVEFSYRSHSSSVSQLSQDLSFHFEGSFIKKYHEILNEIDE